MDRFNSFESGKRRPVTRRAIIGRIGGAGVAAIAGMGVYGTVYEPHHPIVEEVKVPIAGLPSSFEGLRIVQITDLHVQPGFPAEALDPALKEAIAAKPDLVLITGDYINDDSDHGDDYMRACAKALAVLSAPLGVFATFGNHDFPPPPADPDPEPWKASGIRVLNDEIAEIKRGGESFYLVGMRSFIKRPVVPAEVLRLAPPDAVRIVLWHEPDRAAECAREGASLQLSGHTHGGQVVIPFVGPPVLPTGGKLYPSGLFDVDGMPLYVSRGVGLLNPKIRLNCPPEVTVLTLIGKERSG